MQGQLEAGVSVSPAAKNGKPRQLPVGGSSDRGPACDRQLYLEGTYDSTAHESLFQHDATIVRTNEEASSKTSLYYQYIVQILHVTSEIDLISSSVFEVISNVEKSLSFTTRNSETSLNSFATLGISSGSGTPLTSLASTPTYDTAHIASITNNTSHSVIDCSGIGSWADEDISPYDTYYPWQEPDIGPGLNVDFEMKTFSRNMETVLG